MKYIKESLFITTLLLSTAYSQCDANGDGELDVLDVVIEVDCILTDCWEGGSDTTDVCDIDGNCYETIQIGEQLWMAENLKVTHYNNGDEIPTGYSGTEWSNLTTGAYAIYYDDPSNAEIYGNLYNWYAVDDDRAVCPDSWHVPSDEEFMELTIFLGMSEEEANGQNWTGTDEGSKLAGNSELWNDGDLENNLAFGSSGFMALPAGNRSFVEGNYYGRGSVDFFWSSTEHEGWLDGQLQIDAWSRRLMSHVSTVYRSNDSNNGGNSVRCPKD